MRVVDLSLLPVCVMYVTCMGKVQSIICVLWATSHFSSSSPSLMLLMEAEAPFGDEGGKVLGMAQREGGDGERDGENSLGGLLLGEPRGDKAWIIRPLRS